MCDTETRTSTRNDIRVPQSIKRPCGYHVSNRSKRSASFANLTGNKLSRCRCLKITCLEKNVSRCRFKMLNRWCLSRVSLPLCLNQKIPELPFFVFMGFWRFLARSLALSRRSLRRSSKLSIHPPVRTAVGASETTAKPAARTRTAEANPRSTSGIKGREMESEVCAPERQTEMRRDRTPHYTCYENDRETAAKRSTQLSQPFSRARDVHRVTLCLVALSSLLRVENLEIRRSRPSAADRARALHQRSSVARLLR